MPVPAQPRPGPRHVREIAVLRALALGDLLCAVPALRSLRGRFPDARITLIGLPWARELVTRFPAYLDDHVDFPGFPGIPEVAAAPARMLEGLASLQARRFDLAVQLHGNGLVSNTFTALLGAKETAGFVPAGMGAPVPGTWLEYDGNGPEVHRLLRLSVALGGGNDDRPEFPVTGADERDLAASLLALRQEPTVQGYAVVHPGAADPARRWSPTSFAAAADHLARSGLRIFISGTAGERTATAAVVATMTEPAVDLTGRTSLGSLGALIRGADVLLTNDTGVSHVAAGVQTPSVVIFSQADPARWAPLARDRHLALGGLPGSQECRHAPGESHRCLADACRFTTQLERAGVFPSLPEVLAALDALRARWPSRSVAGPR